MWILSENSDAVKPAAIDTTISKASVFVRKDFEFVPESDDGEQHINAHWKYLERRIPVNDWELYEGQMFNRADIDYCLMMLGEE